MILSPTIQNKQSQGRQESQGRQARQTGSSRARPSVRNLSAEDQQAVRNAGFIKKLTSRDAETYEQWLEIAASWPLTEVCRLYSVKGFSCPHGVSGSLQGSCNKAHTTWANLGAADKEKVKSWIASKNTIFKLDA